MLYGLHGAFGVNSASSGVGVTTVRSSGFAQGRPGARAAAPKHSGTASRRARALTSGNWSTPPFHADTTDHLNGPNGRPTSWGANAAFRVRPSCVTVAATRAVRPAGVSGTRRRIGRPLGPARHSAVLVVP